MYLFILLFQANLSNILICVLLHLLICTALRPHIIVDEALSKLLLFARLFCLSSCQSVCLSVSLSVFVSVCLFVCLSVYLSLCLPLCVSGCLSLPPSPPLPDLNECSLIRRKNSPSLAVLVVMFAVSLLVVVFLLFSADRVRLGLSQFLIG